MDHVEQAKPGGCKSNGGCSTGGCNRLNVHDWLINLPFSDPESNCKVVEVSFKTRKSKRIFSEHYTSILRKRRLCYTLEGVSGFDVGEVSLTGELVRLQLKEKVSSTNSVPEIKENYYEKVHR